MAKFKMDVSVSVAANSFVKNVLDGELYQSLGFPCFIELLATGSAAGLLQSLSCGNSQIFTSGPVNANNRVPQPQADEVVSGVEGLPGQGLFLRVDNTTGGALTYRAIVWLEEAEMA